MTTKVKKPRCFKTAKEAMEVAKHGNPRLMAVDKSLTKNGDGFLARFGDRLVCADRLLWTVVCHDERLWLEHRIRDPRDIDKPDQSPSREYRAVWLAETDASAKGVAG